MKTYGDIRPGDLLVWVSSSHNVSYVAEVHLVIGISERGVAPARALVTKRHFQITLFRCFHNSYGGVNALTQYWWDPELSLHDNMMVIR